MIFVFLGVLAATATSFSVLNDDKIDYSGYKILRVNLKEDADTEMVREWAESESVNVLGEGIGGTVDILVSPGFYQPVLSSIEQAEMNYEVLDEDVGREIEEEKKELLRAIPGVFDFTNYYAVRYQHLHLDALARAHSDKAETFSIGTSYEGRDLKAIRISNNLVNSDSKPMIWVDGGIHAREWVSHTVVMYFANALLGEVEQQKQATFNSLLDKYQFVLLPMSNPDGYEYSRSSNRFWRKTRRPSGCKYNNCNYGRCYGIDPNRNFDADFGNKGVSRNPCSDVYPGKQAFSENNTKAMRDYILKNLSQIKLYLSFHSYSQLFLKPIGYTTRKPKDYATHDAAGSAAVSAIRNTYGKVYKNIRSVELYPTSGSSQDWAYLKGIVHSYTIELRDTGRYGFRLPAREIVPTGKENLNAFIALLNQL